MIAVILIILGAIIVGGGIGAGVYYTQKKGTEQTNTGSNLANATPTIPGNTDQENPATSGNGQTLTNSGTATGNSNTGVPAGANGDQTNTNTPSNTNTGEPINTNSEEETSECDHIKIGGIWSLTTDVEGATFTPPYAKTAMNFQFNEDGSVNFTENYNSDGTTASAQHTGSWQRQECNFAYDGIAKGSGTDEEVGFFTFTFKITAGGELSPSDVAIKGDWVSNETYVAADGTTTKQTVIGEWVAKKVSE